MMPYTWGLLKSIPRLGHVSERLEPISGSPPSLIFLPKGCSFSPRCPYVFDTCHVEAPQLAAGRRPPRGRVPPQPRGPRADRPGGGRRHVSVDRGHARTPGRRDGPGEPLLRLEGVKKHFPITRGIIRQKQIGAVHAVDGVDLEVHPGETLGSGRRDRVRQEHARARRDAALRADRRQDLVRRTGHHAGQGRRAPGAAPRHADGVPGSVRVAEPAQDGRVDHRRALAPAQDGPEGQDQARGAGADATRRAEPRALQPLPARVLRRPAPTHRRRPRARAQAEADRVRRAGVGARRVDPGADPQPAVRPADRS